jgi:HlyD family secretion protein
MYNFSCLLAIALVALVGCKKSDNQFDATGNFETDEVIVSSEANGKLIKFSLEEGQTLKAGQQVGFVDTVDLYLQKRQMEAQVYATLAKQPSIKPQLEVIKEQLDKAEFEQKRAAALVAENALRTKDLDDWNSQVELLKRQYIAEASTLNISKRSIISETTPLGFQIKVLEDQLRKCKIINPINGVVLTKYALQDEMTMNSKPLYKIANLDTMTLRAYITDNQLSLLKLGQTVKVFVDKGAENYANYTGIVRWISDKSEFTPKTIQTKDERANLVYAIKIKLKNDGFIKIGMYGEVKFQ